jgi:hypothetical protein
MSEDREKLAAEVERRMAEVPEDSLDSTEKDKLFKIRTMSPDQLGELMIDAASTRFAQRSLVQRLDECATELIQKLDLHDAKTVRCSMEEGLAKMWHMRAGAAFGRQFDLTAKMASAGHYKVTGAFLYADRGDAAKAQGISFEDARMDAWAVEETNPYANPEDYVKRCLIELGVIEPESEGDEPG